MIDQATIDRILDAAQIVDVVSEFVTLRKRGVNYVGLCRSITKRPPLSVFPPQKGYANALAVAKVVIQCISSWNTNKCHTTKH